jgi:LmbE family N-acetylglucosaminyl deacetylase
LGSVLMIAAHPDDENTAVLAYYARGMHMRTGYLSCTRGEGGQNAIGPEQGDLLGIIRTQELLAARKIDGAEQFFTRAIDFGFSKSPKETLEKWGHDRILSDIVRVIRRFRPDVIVLRFSGTPRDGHGQHQASALLGKEAFDAAADPARFPEQLRFVQPWRAKRLLFNLFTFAPEQEREAAQTPGRLAIDTGDYDPVLGHSFAEIAGMSRSMHRSQAMGAPERRGPSKNYFMVIGGAPATERPFDGIDTSWKRVLPGGAAVGEVLARAASSFEPEHPEKTIPVLLQARSLIASLQNDWAAVKLPEVDEAIALCAGLWLDAEADRPTAAPGETFMVSLTAINRSQFPLRLNSARVEGSGFSPAGSSDAAVLAYNQPTRRKVTVAIPADHTYSQPFWLAEPKQDASYTIADPQLIGLADSPPVLVARFELTAGPERIVLTRPVQFRYVDRTQGELVRPIAVAPPAGIELADPTLLFPGQGPKTVTVSLTASEKPAAGEMRIDLARGWTANPANRPFRLSAGEQQEIRFEVSPPSIDSTAVATITARSGDREFDYGTKTISYPHFPVQVLFPRAEARLTRTDVKVLARTVAYIAGAGDEMPQSLRQLGCEVRLLSSSDLVERDLRGFDAIVTGPRAYNLRPDLRANQHRLLDYVRDGGTLIVQYNWPENDLHDLAPYPLEIGRERVTVEEAPVSFPNPSHALLHQPNEITDRDFEGWIQERGLYFARSWDPRFEPVLASQDPAEKPLPGGMLYAKYGKGVYIYTAYSWFRQLPAGVPGAFRVFANLLSAGRPDAHNHAAKTHAASPAPSARIPAPVLLRP